MMLHQSGMRKKGTIQSAFLKLESRGSNIQSMETYMHTFDILFRRSRSRERRDDKKDRKRDEKEKKPEKKSTAQVFHFNFFKTFLSD